MVSGTGYSKKRTGSSRVTFQVRAAIYFSERAACLLYTSYEADHPFEKEAAQFAGANIPFYVCPGTSTWQTLVGRHDNALANLRAAAAAGRKFGAAGFLNTDWGDGGHPQPVSYTHLNAINSANKQEFYRLSNTNN